MATRCQVIVVGTTTHGEFIVRPMTGETAEVLLRSKSRSTPLELRLPPNPRGQPKLKLRRR